MKFRGWLVLGLSLVAPGCGDDTSASSAGATQGSGAGATGGSGGAGAAGGQGGASGGSGGDGGVGMSPNGGADCEALPAAVGSVQEVGPGEDFVAIIAAAPAASTIELADGTYDVSGSSIWIAADGVTLRSASGDRTAVILDGGYDTNSGGVVNVGSVSDVTIADLTIVRARFHGVHVTADGAATDGIRIYNVVVRDPGEQAIKINHHDNGFFPDGGEVACSHLELTPAGRQQVQGYTSAGSNCYTGGVDAHGARGWVVRNNLITGFWCDNGDLAEHGIHFWTGSRDTHVERNLLIDNARGIGFGLTQGGRSYADDPCPGVNDASHYGGTIINNFVVTTDPAVFASPSGMDGGISLAHACGATVAHNTVASTAAPFASIEWRFDDTDVQLVNNLVTHSLMERDGATATTEGNIERAGASEFVDLAGYDLHLADGAAASDAGAAIGATLAETDYDGEPRSMSPDVGADER